MSDDNLLSIGAFALVSGLSINALRHYDELALLRPADVDRHTGYRRYRPGQLRQARIICALRRVDVPIDAIREALAEPGDTALRTVLGSHRQQLTERAHALAQMIHTADHYLEHGVTMPDLKTPRIVQVTINVTDLAESIAFYRAAFDAAFHEDLSSFIFGTWPSDEFFMLTVAHQPSEHGRHVGPDGSARFGLLVEDLDAAHQRAVDAGATEYYPPVDKPWKPRSSCVIDPSGNRIDLYQA